MRRRERLKLITKAKAGTKVMGTAKQHDYGSNEVLYKRLQDGTWIGRYRYGNNTNWYKIAEGSTGFDSQGNLNKLVNGKWLKVSDAGDAARAAAWKIARNNGLRNFIYQGRGYNTRAKGEENSNNWLGSNQNSTQYISDRDALKYWGNNLYKPTDVPFVEQSGTVSSSNPQGQLKDDSYDPVKIREVEGDPGKVTYEMQLPDGTYRYATSTGYDLAKKEDYLFYDSPTLLSNDNIKTIADRWLGKNEGVLDRFFSSAEGVRLGMLKEYNDEGGLDTNSWIAVNNIYNDKNRLPKGIVFWGNGESRHSTYNRARKSLYNVMKDILYTFKPNYNKTKINLTDLINMEKLGGNLRLIPRAKKGMSFKLVFDGARARGDKYFWYNGRTYNTKRRNESDLYWGSHFRDNSTSGGSSNVQTDVGLSGGWEGQKGANAGRYNKEGHWIKFRTDLLGKAPLALKGNDTTQERAYGDIDKPTDRIETHNETGTDWGSWHKNLTTGVVVGEPQLVHTPGTVEPGSFAGDRRYGAVNLVQFYPWGFNGGSGSYIVTPITPGINQPNWSRYNGVNQYFDAGTLPTVEVVAKAPKGAIVKPYIE